MKRNIRLVAVAAFILALLVSGCAPAAEPTPAPAEEAAPEQAAEPEEPAAEAPEAEAEATEEAAEAEAEEAEPEAEEEAAPEAAALEPVRVITSFNIPEINYAVNSHWWVRFGAAETLTKVVLNPDTGYFEVVPWAAEDITMVDDLTWQIDLRDGMTYQHGGPVTAEDLAECLRQQYEAESQLPGLLPDAVFEAGEGVVTISTSSPVPLMPNVMAGYTNFIVYDPALVTAAGEDYAQLLGSGLFTGPYMVTDVSDSHASLVRYDGYWQGTPALPGVEVQVISDTQARMLAVQNGEADIVFYPPSEAKGLLEGSEDAIFKTAEPGTADLQLVVNNAVAPFDNVAMRQALFQAIDYQALAEVTMDGAYDQAIGLFPPVVPYAVETNVTDIEAANALLDAEGWVMGEDGFREKDGETLTLTLLIYPQQPDLVPISTGLQAQLKADVGINLDILSVESTTDYRKENPEDWDISLEFNGSLGSDMNPIPLLQRYIRSDGDRNFQGINDPVLDAMIDEAAATLDEATRNQQLIDIQTYVVTENAYFTYLTIKKSPAIVSPAYSNYEPLLSQYWIDWQTHPAE